MLDDEHGAVATGDIRAAGSTDGRSENGVQSRQALGTVRHGAIAGVETGEDAVVNLQEVEVFTIEER